MNSWDRAIWGHCLMGITRRSSGLNFSSQSLQDKGGMVTAI